MSTGASVDGTQVGLQSAAGLVPLLGVEIEAILDGPCLQVSVRQRYRNAEQVPIEAVYVFPLPEDAAVCGFRARFGTEQVEGRVQSRENAFAAYDDALLDGRMAALLDQERPNVFTASLGNLPAGEEAVLEIRYVARLRPEGDAYRLTFPTTVSPRYVPAQPPEVGQPDGERVNPERWLAVPYGLRFTLHVGTWGQGGLRSVESPSHPVRLSLNDAGVDVALAQDAVALDRDLVVLVQPHAVTAPRALAVPAPDGGEIVLLEFLPDLPREPAAAREVVFMLDCSASMAGDSIAAAKRALQLCVRALRVGDTFDIVRFGSQFQGLWRAPREFDDASLARASAWLEAIDADLGGTEILAPLRDVLSRPVRPTHERVVVLLTDGQVSNEAKVIELAAQHASTTTIFAFGIGAGASDHLVRGVARAGRGEAEMIFPGERIEPKVLRTFARVRSPRFADVRLDTGDTGAQLAPRELPPLFADTSFSVLARYPSRAPATLVLAAGARRWEVPVLRTGTGGEDGGSGKANAGIAPIALCWARERIRDLEQPRASGSNQRRAERMDTQRAELVALGEAYGLLSRETSYVAMSSRVVVHGRDAQLRRVPVALTAGWGGAGDLRTRRLRVMHDATPRSADRGPLASMSTPDILLDPRWPMPSAPSPRASTLPSPARERADRGHAASPSARGVAGGGRASYSRESTAGVARASTPIAKYTSEDLYALLMLQTAEGSFDLTSPSATALIGRLWSDARGLPLLVQLYGECVMTALVRAILRKRFTAQQDLWAAAADKADHWLRAQDTSLFDDVLERTLEAV